MFIAWRLRSVGCCLVIFSTALICGGCHRSVSGESLRNAAYASNAAEVDRILTQNPGIVDDPDPKAGMTPLEFAVIAGDQATVAKLLAHGANVNVNDKLLMNPVAHAVRKGNWPILLLLLNHGAHINNVRFMKESVTLLIISAIEDNKSMVAHLLALGADRAARDTDGKTAADYARVNGNKELVALLENPTTVPTTRTQLQE